MKYRQINSIILIVSIVIMVFFLSCTKNDEEVIADYYSVGVISTQVLSHTTTKVVVKVRFFVYDKFNDNKLVNFDLSNKILNPYDSLKRISLPQKGNFSAAFILSQGLDETINMEYFYNILEPTVRKFVHTATPTNEVLLAKAGDKNRPLEIIGKGFTRNADDIDQSLAQLCKNGEYTTSDTLSLLRAIDSTMDYIAAHASFSNRHLFIMVSRRKYFFQDYAINTLVSKALFYNIHCHILEVKYAFTWNNINFHNLLLNLNTRTNGIYYETPLTYHLNYDWGELPMDLMQVAGNLPSVFSGGTDCFEMIVTMTSSYPQFYSGKVFSSEVSINLSTNDNNEAVSAPFYFYIQ